MASTATDERRASVGNFTVLVAVGNPETAEQLLRTAVDVARVNGGSVRVVSVIHKPYTSPFLLFSDERIKEAYAGGRRRVLERATSVVDDPAVPVEGDLLVGSDVAEAILRAIDRYDADAVLLGWHGRRQPAEVVLGTTIDPVLRRADCDVLVEKVGRQAEGVESILLPTVGGPHAELAADVAGAIATANGASVTALSIVGPESDRRERDAADEHVATSADRLSDDGVPAREVVEEADDVAGAILDAAGDHDLLVLGATRKGFLTRRMVGSVPRRVGQRADCPVIVTKRRPGGSRITRLFDRWWR